MNKKNRPTYSTKITKPHPVAKFATNPKKLLSFQLDTFISLTKRRKLPPISKWKFERENSGGKIFKLPNNKRIIIKPEFWIDNKNIKIAKNPSGGRHMLKLINELVRRKINIEIPLGEIRTKQGRRYYITELKEGRNLGEIFKKLNRNELKKIAKQMGQELARIHKKGVIHGHPHTGNWILTQKGPKLIDVKYINFKEEYPQTNTTNQKETFDSMRRHDLIWCFIGNGSLELQRIIESEYAKEWNLKK